MNKYFVFFIGLFLMLTGCSTNTITAEGLDFFTNHGYLQLIGWALFPRIMFIFFSVMSGGFFFWLGVVFVPRLMVAFWATTYYWDTNPVLCVLAWMIALSGESKEKSLAIKVR